MRIQSLMAAMVISIGAGLLAVPGYANGAAAKSTGKGASGTGMNTASKQASSRSTRKAASTTPAASAKSSLSEAQLAMASQVLVGRAECEFDQSVDVAPHAGHDGSFRVRFHQRTYTMVPEETTTGAVRLVDRRAGVVWLQIPMKSMMMNVRAGRRMVDACTQPAQRVAQSEAAAAALAAAAVPAPSVPGAPALADPTAPLPLLLGPAEGAANTGAALPPIR